MPSVRRRGASRDRIRIDAEDGDEAVEELPIALPLQAVVAEPPLALEQVDRMGVGAEAGGKVEVVIVGIVEELPEAGGMPGVDELAVAFLVDRKRIVEGKGGSARVELGGSRSNKKKRKTRY